MTIPDQLMQSGHAIGQNLATELLRTDALDKDGAARFASGVAAGAVQFMRAHFGDLFAAEFLAQLSDEATLRVPAREVEEFLRTLR